MLANLYSVFQKSRGVNTDSRSVREGELFVALKGSNFNGNRFASDALKRGAIAAVIDDPRFVTTGTILVDDTLKTLQRLANYHRNRITTRIIAITGTNGKTTTKELVAAVLGTKFRVMATKGNLNNHIGLPLTLLSITPDTEYAVVEMGASKPGDIEELALIAQPQYGIITNIGKAHLEGFGSFQALMRTKAELYRFLARNKGLAFVNCCNATLINLAREANLVNPICYSSFCSVNVVRTDSGKPYLTCSLEAEGSSASVNLNTSLVGEYNLENIHAAATVGIYFDVSIPDIKRAIERYSPDNYRSQLVTTTRNRVVLDAYNANPTSTENALRNLAGLSHAKKVAILGEMLELGTYSREEHGRIVQLLKELNFHKVILVGEGYAPFADIFTYCPNVRECASYLKENPLSDAMVLVKGSRGVALENILSVL